MRVHRRQFRTVRGAQSSGRARHRTGQADVCGQSGEHRRAAAIAGRTCHRRYLRCVAAGTHCARLRRHRAFRGGIT